MTQVNVTGRCVWGHPSNGRGKVDNNNQPVIGQDGKQIIQWSFGLAVPKDQCGEIFAAMQAEAASIYPQGVPANFAWKYKDGDGLDDKGQPFANREGYAGHCVFAISTEAFAPRIVRLVNGAYSDMMEDVKCGDYFRVAIDVKGHGAKTNVRGSVPGLYMNPLMLEFLGYGTAIFNGPDAMTLFGGQAVALPAGASAVPVAAGPMPGQIPGGGAHAMPNMMNPAVQMQPGQTAYSSNPPVQPAHDFVQNATGGVLPGQAMGANPMQVPGNAPVPGTAPLPGMPGQR